MGLCIRLESRSRRSPLVPHKQIPRVHLVRQVRKLVAPTVGDDHVAAGLEGLQVVGHLEAEELRRVRRGLLDHHGHAPDLHALHDALDGARSQVGRSFKWCTLTCTSGPLIAATLSAELAMASNAFSPSLTSKGKEWCAAEASRSIRFTSRTPLGAFIDHRRGRTSGILMQSALREKG